MGWSFESVCVGLSFVMVWSVVTHPPTHPPTHPHLRAVPVFLFVASKALCTPWLVTRLGRVGSRRTPAAIQRQKSR